MQVRYWLISGPRVWFVARHRNRVNTSGSSTCSGLVLAQTQDYKTAGLGKEHQN